MNDRGNWCTYSQQLLFDHCLPWLLSWALEQDSCMHTRLCAQSMQPLLKTLLICFSGRSYECHHKNCCSWPPLPLWL